MKEYNKIIYKNQERPKKHKNIDMIKNARNLKQHKKLKTHSHNIC